MSPQPSTTSYSKKSLLHFAHLAAQSDFHAQLNRHAGPGHQRKNISALRDQTYQIIDTFDLYLDGAWIADTDLASTLRMIEAQQATRPEADRQAWTVAMRSLQAACSNPDVLTRRQTLSITAAAPQPSPTPAPVATATAALREPVAMPVAVTEVPRELVDATLTLIGRKQLVLSHGMPAAAVWDALVQQAMHTAADGDGFVSVSHDGHPLRMICLENEGWRLVDDAAFQAALPKPTRVQPAAAAVPATAAVREPVQRSAHRAVHAPSPSLPNTRRDLSDVLQMAASHLRSAHLTPDLLETALRNLSTTFHDNKQSGHAPSRQQVIGFIREATRNQTDSAQARRVTNALSGALQHVLDHWDDTPQPQPSTPARRDNSELLRAANAARRKPHTAIEAPARPAPRAPLAAAVQAVAPGEAPAPTIAPVLPASPARQVPLTPDAAMPPGQRGVQQEFCEVYGALQEIARLQGIRPFMKDVHSPVTLLQNMRPESFTRRLDQGMEAISDTPHSLFLAQRLRCLFDQHTQLHQTEKGFSKAG